MFQASAQQEGTTILSNSILRNSDTTLPTADQLAASRLQSWHQNGEALLTFENLRSWINATGLALFAARPQQLPAPAPSLVEAILGAPNANPILADTEQARSLLARLVTEGIAVPLNLLGTPGETPDFIASAPVFAYIFTLRGDKAWKQPPATTGALKVSPLALATYTLLTERVTLSAYDLTTQLGKEVTQSAVLRALNELWAHLRVLPIPQPDGADTLWELTSGRFTKILKAGANAGQPSALSALISLYLNTAIVATEEEIETFLSPLAARSRIRDVVHALMSARQLETLAIEGKTVLHVAGELPAFLAPEGSILIDARAEIEPSEESEQPETTEGTTEETGATLEPVEGAPRISKFIPKPKKIGTGFIKPSFVKKFTGKPAFGADRERRPFSNTGDAARSDRPARPFNPDRKPSFSKPWQENRPSASSAASSEGDSRPARSYPGRPRPDFASPRADRTDRPTRPARPYNSDRKPAFGSRPAFGAASGSSDSRPPRRDFNASSDNRPPRREFAPRPGGDRPRPYGGDRPSTDRPSTNRPSTNRPAGDRPSFGGPRKPSSFSPRPQAGSGERGSFERRPFTPREGGAPRSGGFNASGSGAAPSDRRSRTSGPPFRKFDAPRDRTSSGDRPFKADRPFNTDRPARPEGSSPRPPRPGGFGGKPSFGGKPAGGFGSKRPGFSKPGSGKPAGTFDKFKNHAKPFGNRPPARKYKPEDSEPGA